MTIVKAPNEIVITLEGPGVRPGRISLAALSVLAEAIQRVVTRMTASVESGSIRKGGRVSRQIAAESELDLTSIETGSVTLTLRPSQETLARDRSALGKAVNNLAMGLHVVNEQGDDLKELPQGFDSAVVRALLDLDELYRQHGITQLSLAPFDGSKVEARIGEPELRVLERLQPPPPVPQREIVGKLMAVNHKTKKCIVFDLSGHHHVIPFDATYADDVDKSLRSWVEAVVTEESSEEGVLTNTLERIGRIRDDEIDELAPARTTKWPRSVLRTLQAKAAEAQAMLRERPDAAHNELDD